MKKLILFVCSFIFSIAHAQDLRCHFSSKKDPYTKVVTVSSEKLNMGEDNFMALAKSDQIGNSIYLHVNVKNVMSFKKGDPIYFLMEDSSVIIITCPVPFTSSFDDDLKNYLDILLPMKYADIPKFGKQNLLSIKIGSIEVSPGRWYADIIRENFICFLKQP